MSCKFFLKGKCVKGSSCDHPHISEEEVCKNEKCVEKFRGFPNHTEDQCTTLVPGIPFEDQTEARKAFFNRKKEEEIAAKAAKNAAMSPEERAAKAAEVAKAKAVQEAEEAKKSKMSPEELKDYMAEKAKLKAEKTAKFAAEKAANSSKVELWGDMPFEAAGGGAICFNSPGKVVNGVAPQPPKRVQNAKPSYAAMAVPGMVEKQKAADKAAFLEAVQNRAKLAEKAAMLKQMCEHVGQVIETLKPSIEETIGELFQGFDFSKLTIEMVVNEVNKSPETNEMLQNAMSSPKNFEGFVLEKLHDAVVNAAAPV